MEKNRRIIQLALAGSILAGGGLICAWLIYTKPAAPRKNLFDRQLEVAVEVIEPIREATPIFGHGSVRAKKQVEIVPQVSGKLAYVHPDLAQGKIIRRGEILFEVDPEVYDARVQKAESEVQAAEVALARHDQEETNLRARLENADQMLAIDLRDYETSKKLFEDEKVGTARDVDVVFQKYLRQKGMVVDIQSQLSMIPHLRLETTAKLEAARAGLRQAKHDLQNTKILCPFEARVEAVHAYQSQVVTAHFSIAQLTDMEAFEISVGIDPGDLQWLAEAVKPEALGEQVADDAPPVKVRWSLHNHEFIWEGRVTRFERVDEATRTARMVVEVRKAEMTAIADSDGNRQRQMLSIGMFCTTELPAEPLVDALLVPRHAVYDNQWVYVVQPDPGAVGERMGRLTRRRIPFLRAVGDAVLVDYRGRQGEDACELVAGERVVVSPLYKPVEGMKVRLRADESVTELLQPDIRSSDPVLLPLFSALARTPAILNDPSMGLGGR